MCAGLPSARPRMGTRTGSRVARVRATRVLAGIRARREAASPRIVSSCLPLRLVDEGGGFRTTPMDTESSSSLHLPSLEITGFRGFDHLTIPRLGRVTLLAGRNAVGKTTVLDAVRLFAARGLPSVLADLLEEREELAACLVEDRSPATVPDVAALFHGRGEAPRHRQAERTPSPCASQELRRRCDEALRRRPCLDPQSQGSPGHR